MIKKTLEESQPALCFSPSLCPISILSLEHSTLLVSSLVFALLLYSLLLRFYTKKEERRERRSGKYVCYHFS